MTVCKNPTPRIDQERANRNPRRLAKVPVIVQMEMLECGAACLAMVLASWKKWVPLERVRAACGVSRDGSNAYNMIQAARSFGLEAKAFRWEPSEFAKSATFPCIVHWEFNHFVVVRGIRGKRVFLVDPANGNQTVSMEEFDRSFTGVVLLFAPSDDFIPDGKRKSVLSFVRRRLKGATHIMVIAAFLSAITAWLATGTPYLSSVFFDEVLPGNYENPLLPLSLYIALSCVALATFVVGVIDVRRKIRISNQLNASSSTSFFWHVLHLPMEFFSQRTSADIVQRMGLNAGIAESLIDTFAPLALSVVFAIVYLLNMAQFSLLLTCVGVTGVLVNILMARIAARMRVDATKSLMRDAAMVESATATGMQMIETIKSAGAEEGFFARWAGYQTKAANSKTRMLRKTLFVTTLPSLVSSLANIAVLLVGAGLVIKGELMVGGLFAFQGILSQFVTPTNQLISAGQNVAETRTNMERVEDVMNYPEQQNFDPEGNERHSDADKRLSGNIVFKDVSFGYCALDAPLIHNFNLELRPGEQVAIVGPSGCGKSTIAKLAMGLYVPWSGQILYDGKPLSQIPSDVFFASAAMAEQEIVLYADTIANNIRMWDVTITDESIQQAARDAQIHDQIMARPGAYAGLLHENGKDLSGGERQRLEIARALAQDPSIIVLDEATSSLDAKTERDVVQALRARGATTLVIAHRLTTVRQADCIVVLDKGRIVEKGTHEELIALGGVYASLEEYE